MTDCALVARERRTKPRLAPAQNPEASRNAIVQSALSDFVSTFQSRPPVNLPGLYSVNNKELTGISQSTYVN